jgi:hypothetical protein
MSLPLNPTNRELKLAIEHLERIWAQWELSHEKNLVLAAKENERRLELANNALARADARDVEFVRANAFNSLAERVSVVSDAVIKLNAGIAEIGVLRERITSLGKQVDDMGWKIVGTLAAGLMSLLIGLTLIWFSVKKT